MTSQGIQIFLPDGDPNGLKIIEVSGWSGKAFVIPRAKLKEMKEQPENSYPAVYYLIGEGDEPSRQKVYIGESENFYKRLGNHDENKDFWKTAIVFTNGLDRADGKYLENQSVSLAKSINRYEIVNQVEPLENKLSPFKKSAIDAYFEKIKFILALFGYALFQEVPRAESVKEIYYWKTDKADAKGTLLDTGEFVVFKGSLARIKESPAFQGSRGSILRKQLEADNVLQKQNEDSYIFTRDYIFSSPSAASGAVCGRSSNGWTCWIDENGKTLDENKRK